MPYCDIGSTSRHQGLESKVACGVVAEPLCNRASVMAILSLLIAKLNTKALMQISCRNFIS
jgi:hypothetical protein